MTEALNNPVRRRRTVESADMELGQMEAIDLALDSPLDSILDIEPVDPEVLKRDFLEALAFNEEPIQILIHPTQEKNPPLVVDIWVQGKGAEVHIRGQWHELCYLPVNVPVVTKRKYVENLLMSKQTAWLTDVGDTTSENPHNRAVPSTSSRANVSILADKNPKGREWLRRVMALKN